MIKSLLTALSIAILFALGAAVGAYLSLEPYQITIIWPPSAIALTAVLLIGNRAIPGITLGAVLTIAIALVRDPNVSTMNLFSVSSVIVMAWIVQPLITRYALAQQLLLPPAWINARAFGTAALVMMLSACIPALSGTAILHITGLTPISDVLNTALIWWAGDATAMITLTPTLYIAAQYIKKDQEFIGVALTRPALALSITGILAISSFVILYNYDSASLNEKINKEVNIFSARMDSSVSSAMGEFAATQALFASNDNFTQESFTKYYENLQVFPSHLHRLIWAQKKTEPALNASATPYQDSSELRTNDFIVKYIMPSKHSASIGTPLDMGGKTGIEPTVNSTIGTAAYGISAEIRYGKDQWDHQRGPAIKLTKAVYAVPQTTKTTQAKKTIIGYVVGEYFLSELLLNAARGKDSLINIYVFSDQVGPTPIWTSNGAKYEAGNYLSTQDFVASLKKATGFLQQANLELADQTLTVVSNGGSEYILRNRTWTAFFGTVSVIALGISIVFIFSASERARIEREKTIALRDAVVVSAQQPFIHLDQYGHVVEWNKAAKRTFGWTEEQMLGKKLSDTLIPERYRDAHEKGVEKYSRAGKGPVIGKPLEMEAVRADNIEVPVSLLINSVKHEGQWNYFAFVSDISEQKSNQYALNEAHEELKRLYEAIPYAIAVYNTDGILVECNNATADMFRTSRESLLGTHYIGMIADRSRTAWMEVSRKISLSTDSTLVSTRDKYYCVTSDGLEFPVELVVTPKRSGNAVTYVTVLRDITQQIAEEKQRQQVELVASLGTMTGMVAHNFNNMLAIIIGNLDILAEKIANQTKADSDSNHVDIALAAALRGSSIVKSLLAVAEQQPMALTVFDVRENLRESLTQIQSTIGNHITLCYEEPPEPLLINADYKALDASILALAVNAAESITENGMIDLTVEKLTISQTSDDGFSSPPGNYAVINLTDNGAGMSPVVMEQAATPFFTTKNKDQASGLGLSMVASFAKRHHGDVIVTSEIASGTSVSICVPLFEPEIDEAKQRYLVENKRCARVLVVDDQPEVATLLISWLESAGCITERADTPSMALEIVSETEHSFDLLITDVIMPQMNGFELFKSIRNNMPDIEAVYITGTTADTTNLIFGNYKPYLLEKPFRKAQILAAVDEQLSLLLRTSDSS